MGSIIVCKKQLALTKAPQDRLLEEVSQQGTGKPVGANMLSGPVPMSSSAHCELARCTPWWGDSLIFNF